MPSNPMQKKVRNSILLGMFFMLIICLIAGVIIYFMFLKDILKTEEQKEQTISYVYKLKQDVKQGDTLSSDIVESVEIIGKVSLDAFPSKIQDVETKKIQDIPFTSTSKAKADLLKGTILTSSMLYDEETDNSLRYVEYGMLTLPSNIAIGDYVDIRLSIPSGADYIVLSKVRIENLISGTNTIGINLDEESIVTLTAAIVDSYIMKASNLYITEYVDASIQDQINKTYIVPAGVIELIQNHEQGNISVDAINALNARWQNGAKEKVRDVIDSNIIVYGVEDKSPILTNIEEGILKQIEDAQKAREAYLSGITPAVTE